MTHLLLPTGYTACGVRWTADTDTTSDHFFVTCHACISRTAHE